MVWPCAERRVSKRTGRPAGQGAGPRGSCWFAVLVLASVLGSGLCASAALADVGELEGQPAVDAAPGMPLVVDPFGSEVRLHYYELLRRSPWKALLLDVALPGAGSVYTHLYANTAVAATLSLVGAGLWIAGAVKAHDGLWWAGAGTFAAGRVYGIVSAPVGATLLNAAFRRHLGLVLQPQ